MKGKYIWPVVLLIWFDTMLCIVSYIDSLLSVHPLNITFFDLLVAEVIPSIIIEDIIKYNVMLVKDKFKLPNIGVWRLIKSLISNWSKGFVINKILFVIYSIEFVVVLLYFFFFLLLNKPAYRMVRTFNLNINSIPLYHWAIKAIIEI